MTTFPKHLILIRHAQSVANLHVDQMQQDSSLKWKDEFRTQHPSTIRLTKEGRSQAAKTGRWLEGEYSNTFANYATSEYIRAQETAALLNLKDARWIIDPYLRETERGKLDKVPLNELAPEQIAEYESALKWYSRVPGAETMTDVCIRGELALQRLHMLSGYGPVLVVSHGGLIWKLRQRIEGWPVIEYNDQVNNPANFLDNCALVEYIQQDGELLRRTGTPHLGVIGKWKNVVFPRYSNKELLANVEKH